MKEVVVRRVGPPAEVVELAEVEAPRAAPGQVVVALEAVPIHPIDLLHFRGMGLTTDIPFTPGTEGAGVVVEVGAGVDRFAVGDRVLVPVPGTFRERMALPATAPLPLPAGIDLKHAATLFTIPLTASLLLEQCTAKKGEWILQNGAASAVGRLVGRLAEQRGLRTLHVVRRDSQADELRAMGASHILVGDGDLAARVTHLTKAAPVRFGLDALGGAHTRRLAECLADGATLVCHGAEADVPIELPSERVLFGSLTLKGFSLARAVSEIAPGDLLRRYMELGWIVASKGLTAPIEATYPLTKVRDALLHAERPGRHGKVLLVMGELAAKG